MTARCAHLMLPANQHLSPDLDDPDVKFSLRVADERPYCLSRLTNGHYAWRS